MPRQKHTKRDSKNTQVGRVRLYADENIDIYLILHLRSRYQVNITSAIELGLSGRDDAFHFQQAKRQGRFLLTRDKDFLNHRRFPFNQMIGVIVLDTGNDNLGIGYSSLWLTEHIVPSGNDIAGTKMVIRRGSFEIHWQESGQIKKQTLLLK